MTRADPRLLAVLAAAWVVAGLNLGLLFDLKATATTLTALILLNGLALPLRLQAVVVAGFLGAGVVFAAFLIQPAAGIITVLAMIAGLAGLMVGLEPGLDKRRALMLAAAFAVLVWPAFLGLVSNSVVEIACPEGGIEAPCFGFYRVGTN